MAKVNDSGSPGRDPLDKKSELRGLEYFQQLEQARRAWMTSHGLDPARSVWEQWDDIVNRYSENERDELSVDYSRMLDELHD